MLMDLETLQWDESICADFGIPMSMLPEIRSSSEVYGTGRPRGNLAGVPVAGILGDQQAATFGQACLSEGEAKNTYGTGNFMLLNTGTKPVHSKHGLLTTVCYKLGEAPAVYALEGSVAVTGSLVQWLRDNLGIIQNAKDIEPLAASVDDNGGAYFVPAFSGLFAPRWRPDARGVIVGLTRFVNKGHLARAALEATAYQTREVIDAMRADSGVELSALKVDGGMVVNETLMQFSRTSSEFPSSARWSTKRQLSVLHTQRASPSVIGPTPKTSATTGPSAKPGNRRWTSPKGHGCTRSGTRPSSGRTTGPSNHPDPSIPEELIMVAY